MDQVAKLIVAGIDAMIQRRIAEQLVARDKASPLPYVIAQLRHAYAQLAAGTVLDQKQFADGLIAPQIAKLEQMQ